MDRRDFIKGISAGVIGWSLASQGNLIDNAYASSCMVRVKPQISEEDRKHYSAEWLLDSFDRFIKLEKSIWKDHYGKERADALIKEFRDEFEALIPEIPFIGEEPSRFLFDSLKQSYFALSKYKVLKRYGNTLDKIANMLHNNAERSLFKIPWFIRLILGRSLFSNKTIEEMRRSAAESQERKYPGNWVYTFIPDDGKKFDYGIDITECPVVKCFPKHEAEEFIPCICPFDDINSHAFGYGLFRTKLIARRDATCDFRFKWEMPPWRRTKNLENLGSDQAIKLN